MTTRMLATLVASGALLALPAGGFADPGNGKGKGHTKSHANHGKSKRCAKSPKVGYVVHGTLVSLTADDPNTPANEGTVTITVTGANHHARHSGEIADQDATKKGVQVAGATYTVPTTDAYVLKLEGFEGADTPSAGDAVDIVGKVAVTKKKCAPSGTSTADRYATPNVRTVTVTDKDPDA